MKYKNITYKNDILKKLKYFEKNKTEFYYIVHILHEIKQKDTNGEYEVLQLLKKIKDNGGERIGLKCCKDFLDIFRYVDIIKHKRLDAKFTYKIINFNINDIKIDYIKDMICNDIEYSIYIRKKKIEDILK
jgi:hypothetical protein